MIVKFNNLQGEVPDNLHSGSHTKILWSCDCGRKIIRQYARVTSGKTKSCGKCNWLNISPIDRFGHLRIKDCIEASPRSNKRAIWVCDCGRSVSRIIGDVLSGRTSSCGQCTTITASDMADRKFGHLKMKCPADIIPGSHKKVTWMCDCGREKAIDINSVMIGCSKSCGHCNDIPADRIAVQKFGRLKLKTPIDISPGSAKKAVWVCDCGNETIATFAHVTSGHTKSCGKCWLSMKADYEANNSDIRKLKTPIEPNQLPDWCPIALETIRSVSDSFRALCRLCGQEYAPRWDGIRLGRSLSCGCTTSRVSSGQQELYEFITSLGLNAKIEHTIGGLKYDIFIPEKVVIEYAGLRWHSFPDSRWRDLNKYRNSIAHGLRHVMIFEDEWTLGRSKVETYLRNLLGKSVSVSIRPSACVVRRIASKEADGFYEMHHYIGKCKAPINYGVYFKDNLVCCCSFKRPTRQSKHQWELVRMASDDKFRVHGVWSKVLKIFVSEFKPSSIVSFSDNRLFTGEIYEKLGFKLDGEVKPDYFWWKNKRRFHKSSLRKPVGEIVTEVELRRSQGYARIWDLGKKRWVYS